MARELTREEFAQEINALVAQKKENGTYRLEMGNGISDIIIKDEQ